MTVKKLVLLLLIVSVFSFGQTPYTSYYENGKIELTGEHYELYTEYEVSAESGLNLRESPDLKSKKVAKLPFGLQLKLLSKTGKGLTVIDTDKKTGIKKEIKGEWIEVIGYIVVDYDKENIKHRSNNSILLYKLDGEGGGPDPWQDEKILKQTPQLRLKVKGYVFDGFIEKTKRSLRKGVWTHYAESGVITKEEFYVVDEFDNPVDRKGEKMAITQYNNHLLSMANLIKLNGQIKTIQYDIDGGITEILEQNIELKHRDHNWGPDRISNTFHKNGKIKCVNESSGGGAVNYCLDKNGKPLGLNNYGIGDERLILSENIRNFKLTHRVLQKYRIEQEQKLFIKPTEFENGRWISTVDSLSGVEIKNGKWIMFYKNGENESTDVYDFKIRGEYVKIFGSELKLDKYLMITNDRSGTLEYYIIEYSNKLLSLSYLPRGNTLNYKPEMINR